MCKNIPDNMRLTTCQKWGTTVFSTDGGGVRRSCPTCGHFIVNMKSVPHHAVLPGCLVPWYGEGTILLAGKAYDNDTIRLMPKTKGWANIHPNNRKIFCFTNVFTDTGMGLSVFNKLKPFRDIATRYDKKSENFLAASKLVSVRIWIKTLCVYALAFGLITLP